MLQGLPEATCNASALAIPALRFGVSNIPTGLSCSSEHGRIIFERHNYARNSLRNKMTALYLQTKPDCPAISDHTVRRILIKFSIGVFYKSSSRPESDSCIFLRDVNEFLPALSMFIGRFG